MYSPSEHVTLWHILEHSQMNVEETQNFSEETVCTTNVVLCVMLQCITTRTP